MKKNYDENEFSELKKDLQDLPKIKAPENFEFNLMTRIQNKNFGSADERRLQFSWMKFLAPSAVVVTVIILFFVFLPITQQDTSPVLKQSQQAINQSVEKKSGADINAGGEVNSAQQENKNQIASSDAKNVSAPNRVRFPINNPRAIRLDDYISGTNDNPKDMKQGNVVKSGEEPSGFDGFYISEKPDKKTLEKYRAQLDSIKKAQAKADSLKKARK